MKQKRWETEEQILNRIEQLKRSKERLLKQAKEATEQSKIFRTKALSGNGNKMELETFAASSALWFHKSEKKFLAADKRNATLKFMGEKLAAFRTQLLPMDGNTDKAAV